MAPLFKGLGYGMLVIGFLSDLYYTVVLAWTLFFLFAGFTSELPWGTCTDKYNTYDCYSLVYQHQCIDIKENTYFYQQDCREPEYYCTEHKYREYNLASNSCVLADGTKYNMSEVIKTFSISPAEDYFNGNVLGLTINATGAQHTMEDYGGLRWQLVLCLLGAWAMVLLILTKGIQSYGKAAYVITLSPYFVLTALLIYTVQLDGAADGIEFYLNPEWEKLNDFNVWAKAASQILFSLTVGFGSQLILSSYNKFTNNTFRDSMLIALFNSLTSIYAGFVVFSIVGFLSFQTQKDIKDVVTDGIKLAFVSYPTAVLEMDVAPLWSFLFFFMLMNLALSTSCGGVQNFVAFIIDEWPSLAPHRLKVLIGVCVTFFFGGLTMCFDGGLYLFNIFDNRLTASLLMAVLLEVTLVSWVYGINNFLDNLKEMGMDFTSGWKRYIGYFWKAMLCVITPVILAFLTVMAWVEYVPMELNNYTYSNGWQAFGWAVELGPIAVTFLYPIFYVYRVRNKLQPGESLWHKMITPTHNWYETERGTASRNPVGEINLATVDLDAKAIAPKV
jgi:solute carrier family 6 amino acid transporter-like protein 5/7/9/14